MTDTAIGLSRKIHQFPFLYVIPPFYEFAECSSNIRPSIKRNISTIRKNIIYLYIPTPSSILYYLHSPSQGLAESGQNALTRSG